MHAPARRSRSAAGRARYFAGALVAGALLAACDVHDATAPHPTLASTGPKGKNAPVHVTPDHDTLDALYDTLVLAASSEVTWSSLTPLVTEVDAEGRVVSVGPGLGLVEALSLGGRKADTAEILVRQLVASLEVTPESLEVVQDSTATLTATVRDANGYAIVDVLVSWVSDLVSIATVIDGLVTGVDTGATTVRAGVDGVEDTARVYVVPAPANPYP